MFNIFLHFCPVCCFNVWCSFIAPLLFLSLLHSLFLHCCCFCASCLTLHLTHPRKLALLKHKQSIFQQEGQPHHRRCGLWSRLLHPHHPCAHLFYGLQDKIKRNCVRGLHKQHCKYSPIRKQVLIIYQYNDLNLNVLTWVGAIWLEKESISLSITWVWLQWLEYGQNDLSMCALTMCMSAVTWVWEQYIVLSTMNWLGAKTWYRCRDLSVVKITWFLNSV